MPTPDTGEPIPEGFAEALGAYRSGDLTRAARLLGDLARQHPDHAGIAFGLAMTNRALGRHDDAEAAYRVTLRLDPEHPHARAQLDSLLAERRRAKDADHVAGAAATDAAAAPAAAQSTDPYAPAPAAADLGTLAGSLDAVDEPQSDLAGDLLVHGRRRIASHRSFWLSGVFLVCVIVIGRVDGLVADVMPDGTGQSVLDLVGDGLRGLQLVCGALAVVSMCLAAASSLLTTVRIFERRIELRSGVLLRRYRQVWLYDVNDLQLSQTPLLALAGTGRLRLIVDEPVPDMKNAPSILGMGSYAFLGRLLAQLQPRVLRERRAMKKQFV